MSHCPKNHLCPIHEPLLQKGRKKYVGLFLYYQFQLLAASPGFLDCWEKIVPKQVLNCTYAMGALQEMSQMSCLWCMCYATDLLWPLILMCPASCAYIDWFGAPCIKQAPTNIAWNYAGEIYLSKTTMPLNQHCSYSLFKPASFCMMTALELIAQNLTALCFQLLLLNPRQEKKNHNPNQNKPNPHKPTNKTPQTTKPIQNQQTKWQKHSSISYTNV